jgi:hypothetical protein
VQILNGAGAETKPVYPVFAGKFLDRCSISPDSALLHPGYLL